MFQPPTILLQLEYETSKPKQIEIYLQACREIQYEVPKQALVYCQKALELAKRAGMREREVHCLRMCGITLFADHEYEAALSIFKKCLPKYSALGDESGRSKTYQNIGLALRGLGKNAESLVLFDKAVAIAKKNSDVLNEMTWTAHIGATYSLLNQPAKALEAYSISLAIAERLENKQERARIMSNIADVYINTLDHEMASDWAMRSLDLYRSSGNKMGIGLTLLNLGRVYRGLEKYDQARTHMIEAVAVLSELNDTDTKARALFFLGLVEIDLQEWQLARKHIEEALELFIQIREIERELRCRVQLVNVNIKLKNFQSAHEQLLIARDRSVRTDNYSIHIDLEAAHVDLAIEEREWQQAITKCEHWIRLTIEHSVPASKSDAYEKLAFIYEKIKKPVQALRFAREGFTAQLEARDLLRIRHSQSLQLRLDVEKSERLRELEKLKSKQLSLELELKTREINTSALRIAQKNELLTLIAEKITDILAQPTDVHLERLKLLLHEVEMHKRTGEEWKNFAEQLHLVHDEFRLNLIRISKQITAKELTVASLLRLNLSSKEIANLCSLTPETVDVYRSRLRKKLKLEYSQSLTLFLQAL